MDITVRCPAETTCTWITGVHRGYWKMRPEVLEFLDSRGVPFRAKSWHSRDFIYIVFPVENAKDAMLFKLTWC